ncbi:hypothetical protein C8Q74DRAFT_813642 [Fomes fomentarius]|nr:hypothetical protein C8Q74DRAFT_813642 [Fomes fomentarius]
MSALESSCRCKRRGRMQISTNCCTDRGSRYSQCLGIDWRKNKANENLARALGSARGLVWLPGGRSRLDCPPGLRQQPTRLGCHLRTHTAKHAKSLLRRPREFKIPLLGSLTWANLDLFPRNGAPSRGVSTSSNAVTGTALNAPNKITRPSVHVLSNRRQFNICGCSDCSGDSESSVARVRSFYSVALLAQGCLWSGFIHS